MGEGPALLLRGLVSLMVTVHCVCRRLSHPRLAVIKGGLVIRTDLWRLEGFA